MVVIRLALQTADHPLLCLSNLQLILELLLLIRLFVHLLWTAQDPPLDPYALPGAHLISAPVIFHYPLRSYLLLNSMSPNHHMVN
jgi:hypothetical protein